MNTTQREMLQRYYTPRQVQAWFGARSDMELAEILSGLSDMTQDERVRFGRQLAAVRRQQRAAYVARLLGDGGKRSVFGAMLVQMGRDARGKK